MNTLSNSLCKNPSELSQQEQRTLMHKLEQRFQGRQFASQEAGERAVNTAISEYLGCSPQVKLEPHFIMWFGLVMMLLVGAWLYRSRRQNVV